MADNWVNNFLEELRRRKVIRVAVVYLVAAWVAVEVASVVFPALLLPEWTSRLVVALALLGFPVALVLAWAFEVKPERPRQVKMATGPEPAEEERLDGWKRIAKYLNRDVRTVRRWEKDQNLPVRRLMHDKLATVYAYRSELDNWRQQRDTLSADRPSARPGMPGKQGRRWVWLAAPLLALGSVAIWYWPSSGDPPITLGEWDWVLVTHFDNRTGEEVLEGTVEYALQRELANSRQVKVAPRERVNAALSLMKRSPDLTIDLETGREISLRDGGIKMLVTGRVEKVGNTYLISSQLVNPADGVTLSSFSTEARNQDEILPSIRTLAQQVRAALGEGLASIEASAQMLSKATTPSLEALSLYSEAERVMRGPERNRAIPILEQALRIDPDFASAHLLLVYVLRDRDEPERAREHLRRAVELAEQSSERERLFILATYYRHLNDTPKTIETYELLTRLYPDHSWANGNLGHLLSWQGRLHEAYPYKLRQAENSPNNEWSQYFAAQYAIITGEKETAGQFIDRVQVLADYPVINSRVQFFPVHAAWVEGDYAQAVRLTEELVSSMPQAEFVNSGQLFANVRSLFQSVGRLGRLREVSAMRPQVGWLDALMDYDSGNTATMEAFLDGEVEGYWSATLMALTGRNEEASELIEDPRSAELLPPPYLIRDWRNLARGQLALSEGRLESAVDLLGSETLYLSTSAPHAHQFAMHSLAVAYKGQGQVEAAIKTLEANRKQGPTTIFTPGATWIWLHNQVMLYELYRDSGQMSEAASVAAQLRELLQLADEDHPFLLALE